MAIHQVLNPRALDHPEPMNMGLSDNKGYLILGVLILRGLLCRLLYIRVPYFRKPPHVSKIGACEIPRLVLRVP